ncbi:AAA family ATPase [Curtobacterium flaccumfaciens]|uniref:AAA family ATPase n=1 Tax=Curtobacterium flaccumfaciens TaxID=2035 RepID=UPI00188C671D|nr:AAA family ATPase [Curtobacterium flaccumfaciens]
MSRSLLLSGTSGTGKTTLALNSASRMGRPAVIARLDGLISSFLGNTDRDLGAVRLLRRRVLTPLHQRKQPTTPRGGRLLSFKPIRRTYLGRGTSLVYRYIVARTRGLLSWLTPPKA